MDVTYLYILLIALYILILNILINDSYLQRDDPDGLRQYFDIYVDLYVQSVAWSIYLDNIHYSFIVGVSLAA